MRYVITKIDRLTVSWQERLKGLMSLRIPDTKKYFLLFERYLKITITFLEMLLDNVWFNDMKAGGIINTLYRTHINVGLSSVDVEGHL